MSYDHVTCDSDGLHAFVTLCDMCDITPNPSPKFKIKKSANENLNKRKNKKQK